MQNLGEALLGVDLQCLLEFLEGLFESMLEAEGIGFLAKPIDLGAGFELFLGMALQLTCHNRRPGLRR